MYRVWVWWEVCWLRGEGGGRRGFVVLRESYRRVVYRESVGENVVKESFVGVFWASKRFL